MTQGCQSGIQRVSTSHIHSMVDTTNVSNKLRPVRAFNRPWKAPIDPSAKKHAWLYAHILQLTSLVIGDTATKHQGILLLSELGLSDELVDVYLHYTPHDEISLCLCRSHTYAGCSDVISMSSISHIQTQHG